MLLNFFRYRKTAIGPYNEVGLSILCYPKRLKNAGPFVTQLLKDAKMWTMGAYVINLPVTTEIAYTGGREVWSYPKFVTNIIVDLKGRQFNGVVDNPVLKKPIFTLRGSIFIAFFYSWKEIIRRHQAVICVYLPQSDTTLAIP